MTVAGVSRAAFAELPGGQRAALVELDQQLELGVAQLRAAQVGIASAQTIEAAKHPAECHTQLAQLGRPLPARCGRVLWVSDVLIGLCRRSGQLTQAPSGSIAASAFAAPLVSFARGFSARSSTRQGISPSAAVANDHQ